MHIKLGLLILQKKGHQSRNSFKDKRIRMLSRMKDLKKKDGDIVIYSKKDGRQMKRIRKNRGIHNNLTRKGLLKSFSYGYH